MLCSRPPAAPRAAFTLLELLVVLIIIGILAAAFVGMSGNFFDQRGKQTRLRMTELSNLIEQYRTIQGEYPNDKLPSGAVGNTGNAPSEALVLAFFAPDYTGSRPDQEWLVNTDADESSKSLTIFPSKELFEIGDAWGNPIAYLESLHYGDAATVVAGVDLEPWEQPVQAQRDARTGAWERPSGFQLISAGEDGDFGTEDDITNFSGP